jgi:tetratricopeptide (TPR) repeat protein
VSGRSEAGCATRRASRFGGASTSRAFGVLLRVLAMAGLLHGLFLVFSPEASSQAKKPAAKKPAAGAAAKSGGGADAGAPAVKPTQESEVWTGGAADAGPVQIYVPPPPRKITPPPPPPTPEQIKGLEQLQAEAVEYEKAAKDYRDATTRIVQYHYEDKRRRMLASLDGEIAIEKKALGVAREDAIKRLEEFVARYSGKNAHPENTPDAMFRLAALYEERVRSDSPDDLSAGLRQAIDLYKRVIVEFPNYRELAGIFYYLGHALSDSNRIEEAQQVWRSLVCHNKFPYPVPPDPKDPSKDTIVRLPQDHDDDYWRGWENAHPTPVGFSGKAPPKTGKGGKPVAPHAGENQYNNPYPEACVAIPQQTDEGAEPRYVAEIWWQIGNWHFDQIDPHGGPYNLNRAATAYQQSMKFKKPPLYGVAMYKLAWTYFKQQRYETAVREFVNLLNYTDEQEKATGDPGTDFRAEAYTYIAGSLTYLDFAGPGPDDPFIARNDVLDTESNPMIAEQKMHVAIDRVQDPKLIPQDKKWSFEVYKALAQEYREVNQWHNAIEVSELILRKWPMNRDAPNIQNQIADIYEELTRMSRMGSPERDQNAARALESRTKLAAYVGNTPWVDANRDDPEAIQSAERLVKGGLRRAAADHTNLARAYVGKATETGDAAQQKIWLERALSEYKLADVGWSGFLRQDENAPDAYETRFWIADARHGVIVVTVNLDRSPSIQEINNARQAAVDVRDSNEDDKFLQPAAYYVVDVAEQALQDQYRLHARTGGAQGFKERTEVRFVKAADGQDRVVADPIPPYVQAGMAARDEYVQRVPPSADTPKNSIVYQFQVADTYFLYGHFDQAKARFEPLWRDHCNKDEYGYKAWGKLITIAARSLDVKESRRLAEAEEQHSCAVTAEQQKEARELTGPVKIGGAYIDAGNVFKQAEKMKDGPERAAKWREAAAAYNFALTQPGGASRDEAPEAAMNGAFAYKQVGEYDKAIKMYELFINNYGDEKTLAKLEQEKNPRYPERVKYLKQAYDTLSKSYVLFFNYRAAAETYDKISSINRFEEKDRRDAARNALVLYSNMADTAKMTAVRQRLMTLGPSAQEKAEADFIVADSDMKAWDPRGAEDGANRNARQRATNSMMQYYDANKNIAAASKYVVEAAYNVARMRQAADANPDEWRKKTIVAFERYKGTAGVKDGKNEAMGSREAGFAAECEYAMLDAELKKSFDYDTGHHRYAGSSVDVIKKFQADAVEAKKHQAQLQHVIDAYASAEWATAAISRQGSLYDSMRTGLYNTRAPQLKLVDAKTEAILKRFENSDNPDDQDKADQIRQKVTEAWRAARERELGGADEAMIHFYAQSVALAKRYNVRNAAVNRANQRLAFFTDILGEAKMAAYTKGVQGLDYREGLFLQTRPGLIASPQPQPLPPPPVGAQ